jgi:anaerobic magnesium-protoporphyrin IX monomethyl ester cyclase
MTETVLLFDPPLTPNQDDSENFKFNIGLLSIGSFLKSHNIPVNIYYKTKDYYSSPKLKKILTPQIKLVGISSMTAQFPQAIHLAQMIKKNKPKIKIVIGGCHVKLFPNEVLQHQEFDFTVPDDGEQVMLELFQSIQQNKPINHIQGLGYKINRKLFWNKPRPKTNLNFLPRMDYSIIQNLTPVTWYDGQKSMFVYSGNGCPHQCTFCINSVIHEGIRQRNVADVVSEIEFLIQKFHVTHIYPIDEYFCINQGRLLKFLNLIEKKHLNFSWFIQNRIDSISRGNLNQKILQRMKRLGCNIILLGAESGSNSILKKMQKNINKQQIITAVVELKKARIIPWLSFIIGMPDERSRDYIQTLKLIHRIKTITNEVIISGPSLYRPIPGSIMYQKAISFYKNDIKQHFQNSSDFVLTNIPTSIQIKNCHYPWISDKKTLYQIMICIERFYHYPSLIAITTGLGKTIIALIIPRILAKNIRVLSQTLTNHDFRYKYQQFLNYLQLLSNHLKYYFPKSRQKLINQNYNPDIFNPLLWFTLKRLLS